MVTQTQLNELQDAYSRGILKIREGDTWVEYQSMKEMRLAISEMKRELFNSTPTGTRIASTSQGY